MVGEHIAGIHTEAAAPPAHQGGDRGVTHHPTFVAAGGTRRIKDARRRGGRRDAVDRTLRARLAHLRRPFVDTAPEPDRAYSLDVDRRSVMPGGLAISRFEALLNDGGTHAAFGEDLGVAVDRRTRIDGDICTTGTQRAQHQRDGVTGSAYIKTDASRRLDADLAQ